MFCLLQAGIGSEEEVAQDSNPNAFADGGRFGVYEIDRREDGSVYELGRGAMGVTYRATDTTLQRKVACLRSFYRHLQRRGMIKHNPASELSNPRLAKRRPQVDHQVCAGILRLVADHTVEPLLRLAELTVFV